ncbi:flagellar hook-associated protein FlgK [Paracoccus alkanivorans]|uniref:Flagellar hook-associated protein 1 n=1 Tax=Paracoccus alkanivorans TaxID=2116655 RepID=A0A3M0MSB0_9RHOB|nr:flagellar hook-associated protein FlgK [Paracoccus alkanivorans]RMC34197.1 flagellar hook-associated protein FlgK [Paracoccus alkanivorans]
MGIAKALSNAVTGLAATARGTEVVADNLANAQTVGFARREMTLNSRASGGVRIDGIARVVNAGLLAEYRLADAAKIEASTRLDFLKKMEDTIGLPGAPGGLSNMLTRFREKLLDASDRPDDNVRLEQAAHAAKDLAFALNVASDTVQTARAEADTAIAADVRALNVGLARVADLNRRIFVIKAQGKDPSPLVDARQQAIDGINSIVPVQEVPRDAGTVALFTKEGMPLLDGTAPSQIDFQPAPQFSAELSVKDKSVQHLFVDGKELPLSRMRFFAGGRLSSNFEIRDGLGPQFQHELDSLALELHDLFADPTVDPTIGPDTPGLFTDEGGRAEPAAATGLAGRIALNSIVDPAGDGTVWRLRDGLGAVDPGPVGNPAMLIGLEEAIQRIRSPHGESAFQERGSLAARLAILEARTSSRRVEAEADSTAKNSRADAISVRFLSDGVNGDVELQRLLEHTQAYAANARVIQAIDEMMDQILRW